MNRYHLQVVVYPMEPGGEGPGGERVYETRVTARSEHDARRKALEQAHACGHCVSRFLMIRKGKPV